ncbi:MAG: twin-arginine translocation signal domain-containing protein [Anaerolineaceae bacterium]|nr:twin-arginine translocation signal domain-containing protein [Anaerolineaceae bacterium]
MDTKQKPKFSRRDFIKLSAYGAAGALLASCTPKATEIVPLAQATATGAMSIPTATAAPTPTTVVWGTWGGADRLKPFIDTWAKTYPDTAKWLSIKSASSAQNQDYMQYLRNLLAVGGQDMPDLIELNYDGIPELTQRGILQELTTLIAPFKDDIIPAAYNNSIYKGKVAGLPFQVKSKVWYYRKDMFDAAGIDPAQVKTFEDLIAAGKQFHGKYPDGYIMNFGPTPPGYTFIDWLSAYDGIRFADDNGKYLVKSDTRFAEVMQQLKTLYASGVTLKVDDWSADWAPSIANNKIGSFMIESWMTQFIPGYGPDQGGKWKLTLWPKFSQYGGYAEVIGFYAKSKNIQAAFEFASSYWLKADGALAWWQTTGLAPLTLSGQQAVKKAITANERPAGMSDADWAKVPTNYYGGDFMDTIIESMNFSKLIPCDPSFNAEMTILSNHLVAFLADKETLQEAIDKTQSDLETQIPDPYTV